MPWGMQLAHMSDVSPGGGGGLRTYRASNAQGRRTSVRPKKFPPNEPVRQPITAQPVDMYGQAASAGARAATNTVGSGATQNWIRQLRNQSSGGAPKLPDPINLSKYKMPAQVDLDQYRTEIALIDDIAKKYGFDYSRDYAETQAEAMAQAQRDEIQTARERSEWETQRAQENLEHDFFGQFLDQRQQLVDSGLNAGIAAERDLRLDMNRQHALADVFANAQLYNQELDRRSQTIEQEAQAYAERLYNERLAQGFQQAMQYTDREFRENQAMLEAALKQRGMKAEEARWMAEMEMRQRQQLVEERWREYEFNNMSAAEKAKLIADAERFGTEMAWQRHKFEAGLEHELGLAQSGFSGGQKGGGNLSQYRVTSQYGTRTDPITGQKRMHNGIDLAVPNNTPVSFNTGGKVVASGYDNSRGNYIAVQDNNGLVHVYMHLNQRGVKKGDTVRPGQVVGRSGSTGRSTGPHLHYEVRQGSMSGRTLNPTSFL